MAYIAVVSDRGHSLVEVESEPKSFTHLLIGKECFAPGTYELIRSGRLDAGGTLYPLYFARLIRFCASSEKPLASIPLNLKGKPVYT
jgi:hypothetical protein